MKKRMIVILLIFTMMLIFAACGQNDISDQDELDTSLIQDESDTSLIMEDTTIAPPIERGEIRDGVYKNVFWGIGCTLDDSWTFPTKEQNIERELAERSVLKEIFTEVEDLESLLEMSQFDLEVTSESNAANINVILESSTQNYVEEEYVDNSIYTMERTLEELGAKNIRVEKTIVNFINAERFALFSYFELEDIPVYQKTIIIAKGQQMANITVATYYEDKTDILLNIFYSLN